MVREFSHNIVSDENASLMLLILTAILAMFYVVLGISGTSLEDAREANWVGGKNYIYLRRIVVVVVLL